MLLFYVSESVRGEFLLQTGSLDLDLNSLSSNVLEQLF